MGFWFFFMLMPERPTYKIFERIQKEETEVSHVVISKA
jgi:hypothetical protein